MTFYDDMADVSLELLTEFGQTGTITRTTGSTFSGSAGTVTGGTITGYSCTIAVFDLGTNNKDGWLVQQGDKRILMSPDVAITPDKLTDKVTIGSTVYALENVREINPAGTPVLYVLQGRR